MIINNLYKDHVKTSYRGTSIMLIAWTQKSIKKSKDTKKMQEPLLVLLQGIQTWKWMLIKKIKTLNYQQYSLLIITAMLLQK